MTFEEYERDAEPIPELLEIWTRVKLTLFGSIVFGGFNDDSDIDFLIHPVVSIRRYEQYMFYDQDSIYEGEVFKSVYVKTSKGRLFNLLFFNTERSYQKYIWATKEMTQDPRDFSVKEVRVRAFEDYKSQWEEINR